MGARLHCSSRLIRFPLRGEYEVGRYDFRIGSGFSLFPCVGGISNTTVPFNKPQFDTEMLRKLEMDFDAFCLEEARKEKFEERKKGSFFVCKRVCRCKKKRRGGKRGVPSSSVLPPPPSVFQFTSRKERSWRWEISLDFSLLLLSSKLFSPSKTDRKYFFVRMLLLHRDKRSGKNFPFLFLACHNWGIGGGVAQRKTCFL